MADTKKTKKDEKEKKYSNVEILEDSDEVITLFDDKENAVDFYQIACVEYEDEFYAILQPAQQLEGVEDDEALVFKIVEDNDETDLFVPVDSEEIMEKVFNEYLKAAEEENK